MKMFLAAVLFSSGALADALVLDPGDGRQYLANWCGGQRVDEIATGFTRDGLAMANVAVSTRCGTGTGRLRKARKYEACWTVTFAADGQRVSKEQMSCAQADASRVFQRGAATLSTRSYSDVTPTHGPHELRAWLAR